MTKLANSPSHSLAKRGRWEEEAKEKKTKLHDSAGDWDVISNFELRVGKGVVGKLHKDGRVGIRKVALPPRTVHIINVLYFFILRRKESDLIS